MLYERTQEEKYLDFAEHIVAMSEEKFQAAFDGGHARWRKRRLFG